MSNHTHTHTQYFTYPKFYNPKKIYCFDISYPIIYFLNRLEKRNKELEDDLEDMDCSIKTLQEEKTQEISGLKSQLTSYIIKIKEYKHQLIILEKARIDDKFTHTAIAINIDEKYKDTRLILISQIKLLSNLFFSILYDYHINIFILFLYNLSKILHLIII